MRMPPPKGAWSRVPDYHQLDDALWLGPAPRTPEFIRALREAGLDGVVSVQTDGDLAAMGLDWPQMWRFLMARDFAAVRVPIVDFDDASLARTLDEAVQAVDALVGAGRRVYVHCSVGVNRSPTVAIAWLAQRRGLGLDAAWDLVHARRPQVQPNRRVLERWWALRQGG